MRTRWLMMIALLGSAAVACKKQAIDSSTVRAPAVVETAAVPADARHGGAKADRSAAPPAPGNDAQARPADVGLDISKLPHQVLAGTDLEPLSAFLATAEAPKPGRYIAEAGGSTFEAHLRTGASADVQRTYREPGMAPAKKRYGDLRVQGKALVGAGVYILGTKEGILVLELNSGTESISADHWVLYWRPKS